MCLEIECVGDFMLLFCFMHVIKRRGHPESSEQAVVAALPNGAAAAAAVAKGGNIRSVTAPTAAMAAQATNDKVMLVHVEHPPSLHTVFQVSECCPSTLATPA